MFSWHGTSLTSLPWRERIPSDYHIACENCEITIEPTDEQWRRLRASLIYDHSDDTNAGHGRVLAMDVVELGLEKGDRLDPSPECRDIGGGFDRERPRKITMWRRSRETHSRRRNPFFVTELGTDIVSIGGSDWLHTFSLGVLLRWLGWFVRYLIDCNVFRCSVLARTQRTKYTLRRLTVELHQWLKHEAKQGRNHTQIRRIQPNMLGNYHRPVLKLFGAQANTFLKFCGSVLRRRDATAFDERCAKVSAVQAALEEWLHLVQLPENRATMGVAPAQRLLDAMKESLRGMTALEVHEVPKFHQWVHITAASLRRGAPSCWGCWLDEDLNATLKAVAEGAMHGPRAKWTQRVLHGVNSQMERRFHVKE